MKPRIIVIGAGIVGTATAHQLSVHGADVTLVDCGMPGAGTTALSGGWLNANHKTSRAYHDLTMAGIAEYRQLARMLGSSTWLHPTGALEIAVTSAERSKLLRKLQLHADYGHPADVITLEQLRGFEPGLCTDRPGAEDALIVRFPTDSWIETHRLIGELLAAGRAAGLRTRFGVGRTTLDLSGERIAAVVLEDGTRLACDIVVNCAGAAIGDIAAMAGVGMDLHPTPAVVAHSKPLPVALRGMVRTGDINMRPDGGGRLWLHALDLDRTGEAAGLDNAGAELARRAGQLLGWPHTLGIARTGLVYRPMQGDAALAVGWLPGCANQYVVVASSGINMSALIGRFAAREIVLGLEIADLRPHRPITL